ncbi:MAG: hypothetical protein H6Q55_316 [Deltaproteobacteria bacterium]|jgi:hypothetical protein|nr:hypothetical protein [Deltaproteobacteria bacterium]
MKAGIRAILKQITVLNVILLAAALLLAQYTLLPLLNLRVKYKLPPVKQAEITPEEQQAAQPSPPPSEYVMIADQNLFHPDRKLPVDKKDEKQLPRPEIVLYGTLVTDGLSVAYLEDKKSPHNTPGRGRRQQVLKKGEAIAGFMLRDIEADRIVLVRGEEQMVVYLADAKKQRATETTQAAPQPPGPRLPDVETRRPQVPPAIQPPVQPRQPRVPIPSQ